MTKITRRRRWIPSEARETHTARRHGTLRTRGLDARALAFAEREREIFCAFSTHSTYPPGAPHFPVSPPASLSLPPLPAQAHDTDSALAACAARRASAPRLSRRVVDADAAQGSDFALMAHGSHGQGLTLNPRHHARPAGAGDLLTRYKYINKPYQTNVGNTL